MADYRAVSIVCEAIVRQLRLSYRSELFNNQRAEFKVCFASDLISRSRNPRTGVTLFLYSISQNPAARAVPPPHPGGGRPGLPVLQLELRFLLTAWAREVHTQQAITGWIMRFMEDDPVLPASLLNQVGHASFQPHETVEIILDELSSLETMKIWEKSVRSPYQLSIPYIARNIAIATLQPASDRNDPGQVA